MTMYGRPSGSVARSSTLTMLSWRIRLTALRLGEEPLDEVAPIAALARQHLDRDAAADRADARPCRRAPCRRSPSSRATRYAPIVVPSSRSSPIGASGVPSTAQQPGAGCDAPHSGHTNMYAT